MNRRIFGGILAAAAVTGMAALVAGCNNPITEPGFVAVQDITGVATKVATDTDLTLSGTVVPGDATNKTIEWSVTAGSAIITGGKLKGNSAGLVTVRATITNGKTATTAYTKDFTISIYTPGSEPTVTGVTISAAGGASSVETGKTLQFTATVAGTNYPSQNVTWSIDGTGHKGGTSINSCLSTKSVTLWTDLAFSRLTAAKMHFLR